MWSFKVILTINYLLFAGAFFRLIRCKPGKSGFSLSPVFLLVVVFLLNNLSISNPSLPIGLVLFLVNFPWIVFLAVMVLQLRFKRSFRDRFK